MKRSILLCAVLVSMAALSCKKEENGSSGNSTVNLVPVEFVATHADVSVKTAVQDGSIVWTPGDSISVYDGTGVRVFKTEQGGAQAVFKGMAVENTQYYAVYPAGTGIAFNDGKFSAIIPAEQPADASGSFANGANVSVGAVVPSNGGLATTMQSICGYLKVVIEEGNKTINRVKVTSTSQSPLSGNVVVKFSNDGNIFTSILGTGNEVALIPAEGKGFIAPGTYFLPVNPTALGGKVKIDFESALFDTITKEAVADTVSKGKTLSIGSYNPIIDVLEKVGGPEDLDSSADPTSQYGLDYSKLNAMHPRLLLSQEEFVNLLYKIKHPDQNPLLYRMHENNIKYADKVLNRGAAEIGDITNNEDKTKALSGSREVIVQLFTRAYAYKTTKDKKYLNAAISTLEYVCGLENWGDKSYLTTGETSFGVALAYDWLYFDLQLELRKKISSALIKNGIKTAKAGKLPYTSKNNWNQVTNGGIMSAAIATYDIDKALAAERIETGIPSNLNAQSVIYSPNGNTPEGYSYWSYGTEFQTIINEGLISAFGTAAGLMDVEGFSQTADFILYMNGPCGDFGFADGGRNKGSAMYAPWWFAARYNRPDLIWNELRHLNETGYFYERMSTMIPVILSKFEDLPATAQAPKSRIWTGNGETPIALARTSWNSDDSDTYIGFKGGYSKSSHCHMDVGTFVYDAYGARWADDIIRDCIYSFYDKNLQADGVGGTAYFSYVQKSSRWDILESSNIMHNCLVFYNNDGSIDKIHPTDFNVEGKAVIVEKYDDETKLGAKMDLTPLYSGQAASVKRSVMIVNGSDLAVVDEITALPSTDASLEFRLITTADTKLDFDCVEMTQKNRSVYFSTSNDLKVPVEYVVWKAERPETWTVRQWNVVQPKYRGLGFKSTVPAGQTAVFTTMIRGTRDDNDKESGDNERPIL